jgi:hypothetical protein
LRFGGRERLSIQAQLQAPRDLARGVLGFELVQMSHDADRHGRRVEPHLDAGHVERWARAAVETAKVAHKIAIQIGKRRIFPAAIFHAAPQFQAALRMDLLGAAGAPIAAARFEHTAPVARFKYLRALESGGRQQQLPPCNPNGLQEHPW